ncbi:MAG TPA: hypothetical protein ENK52_02870 [Saprospiraceae bacterium]|nr:hypothetical protein [Saprospiraceae bacterium]
MDTEKKFINIQEELAPYKTVLGKAADTIIDENVSSYPIFVVHRLEVSIGIPMIKRDEVEAKWSINASSLEELVTKKVVELKKLEAFKKIYKDPRSFLCLLLLSDFGATFAFLPRS